MYLFTLYKNMKIHKMPNFVHSHKIIILQLKIHNFTRVPNNVYVVKLLFSGNLGNQIQISCTEAP